METQTDSQAGEGQPAWPRMQPSAAELAWRWLHRFAALYCLFFGLLYWIRLIGIHDGAEWRFDLMPAHWQVASVVLATLFPFAASGLWMMASWGAVIWFVCAAAETAMYVGVPELFGYRPAVAISHGVVALLYLSLRLYLHFRPRV